jgi:hypothetical protein
MAASAASETPDWVAALAATMDSASGAGHSIDDLIHRTCPRGDAVRAEAACQRPAQLGPLGDDRVDQCGAQPVRLVVVGDRFADRVYVVALLVKGG